MSDVAILEKAHGRFTFDLSARGHHVVYRVNERNHCPGCGHVQWYVGRISAECGICGTAVLLAEINLSTTGRKTESQFPDLDDSGSSLPSPIDEAAMAERRKHERIRAAGHALQLMIDGSPSSFALQNISAGGVMVQAPNTLVRDMPLHVRFEGSLVVPAIVRWRRRDLVGLAFTEERHDFLRHL